VYYETELDAHMLFFEVCNFPIKCKSLRAQYTLSLYKGLLLSDASNSSEMNDK
jgi:hypothetical protein